MAKKIKVGLLGLGRGVDIALGVSYSEDAEVTAVCDKDDARVEMYKKRLPELGILYTRIFLTWRNSRRWDWLD